jgi:prephenate dehydrogenase
MRFFYHYLPLNNKLNMASTAKKIKVTILGGYGGMGRFFAALLQKEGFEVTINGPDELTGKKIAKEIYAEFEKDPIEAVGGADIVIVSVPIKVTLDVIKEIAPHVKKGSLLMDVTSVKEKPCEYMDKYSPAGVEVIGTHPMFGHRVPGLEGQVFILTPVRSKKWLAWLKDFLAKHKARVYESTPREHDHVMAVVQGLTHFTYISIGKTLADMDFNVRESRKFSSPIYELMLDMVGRIIGQSPELYASIQMSNPQIPHIHKVFLQTAEELSKAVREKDQATFVKTMKAAAQNFDDLDRAMGRSDKAINALAEEINRLKESVGKEIALKHIYSGTIHLGIVKSMNPETVTLDEYGKKAELKISNLEILSDSERIKQKKEKLGSVARDYSYVFSEKTSEDFLAKLLLSYDESIIAVKIKDVYKGKKLGEGTKSVCFGIEIINHEVKETEKKIKNFFESIGGAAR